MLSVTTVTRPFGMESVRVVLIDGEPWFIARDVAAVLGYAAPDKAVRDHCKGTTESVAPTAGGAQTMSSRETAEPTGKGHGHVMRDIDDMLDGLGQSKEGYIQKWTHPQNKQDYAPPTAVIGITSASGSRNAWAFARAS
ncbi:BRO family protein [Paraburkholderia ginsengisoli]|nr:BRO family protein [Paraburkholderia ginsengisoli]